MQRPLGPGGFHTDLTINSARLVPTQGGHRWPDQGGRHAEGQRQTDDGSATRQTAAATATAVRG
jgi:hypothetical protein